MPVTRRTLTLLLYAVVVATFVSINAMLGYYVFTQMRTFSVVITGADRTNRMPAYERSLYQSLEVSEEELQGHVREIALTDLVDKIDDLGQTIRLLIQSAHPKPIRPNSVALITPITSEGSSEDPENLPLFSVSLPSLCETASAGYHYTYFLCYTQGDIVFSNAAIVNDFFAKAKQLEACGRWREGHFAADFVLVEAGPRITGKRALSILFNLPTLRAFTEGYQFFYLINDDLRFVSSRWTEELTNQLLHSTVMPYFGITGGLDISSPQPFAEFPFFHRRHVDILGDEAPAHPYIFHNWWEDNWMTDTYLPWNASYYRTDVLVENYAGLSKDASDRAADESAEAEEIWPPPTEPRRYQAKHDLPPPFYIREVERARFKVRQWLERNLPEEHPKRRQTLGVEVAYCRHINETLTFYSDPAVNPCQQQSKGTGWRYLPQSWGWF